MRKMTGTGCPHSLSVQPAEPASISVLPFLKSPRIHRPHCQMYRSRKVIGKLDTGIKIPPSRSSIVFIMYIPFCPVFSIAASPVRSAVFLILSSFSKNFLRDHDKVEFEVILLYRLRQVQYCGPYLSLSFTSSSDIPSCLAVSSDVLFAFVYSREPASSVSPSCFNTGSGKAVTEVYNHLVDAAVDLHTHVFKGSHGLS